MNSTAIQSTAERGRCAGLTILPVSVSRLSEQCGIFNISQPYRPPWPVMGIALLFLHFTYILTEICSVRRLSDDKFLWKPVRTAFGTGTELDPSNSFFSSSHTAVRVSSNQSQTRSCTNYTNRLKKIQVQKLVIQFSDSLLPNVIYI
jgi:hypothetical protein